MLISIEIHITCDFPRGGGGTDPLSPLWIRTWRRALKHLVMFQAFVVQTYISRVTTSNKAGISEPFEQPTLCFDKDEWTSKIEYFDPWILNVCVCWYQWLFNICRKVVVVYILHYFSKHFTRAIFIEETNSLAQILCTCKHEKPITLIVNKMLVAFAFRPLAVLYMLSCIKNNELKRTKLNQRITLVYLRQYLRHLYTSYMYIRSYELQKI